MQTPREINLSEIRIGDRLRKADPQRITGLADSIAEIGLQTPVHVAEGSTYADGQTSPVFDLVAGLHRVEACKQLGLATILAFVMDEGEIDRGLWECDENLTRAELSDAARAKFTARRKELYEIKHPETRKGGDRGNQHTGSKTRQSDNLSFSHDTAQKTGKTARTIQRDARRGERIEEEVLDEIEGTELDKGTVLDQLARLKPTEQRAAVKRLKAGKTAKPKARITPEPDADMERVAQRLIRTHTLGELSELVDLLTEHLDEQKAA